MKKKCYFNMTSASSEEEIVLGFEDTHHYDPIKLSDGKFVPPSNWELNVYSGSRFYDLNVFSDGLNQVISKRFYEFLVKNNLKGWSAYPVTVSGNKEKFYIFIVSGRAGVILAPEEEGFYVGIKLKKEPPSDLDFFCPKKTSLICCSEKTYKLLVHNRFTNIVLKDLEHVSMYSNGNRQK